jgi:hypothetical protein
MNMNVLLVRVNDSTSGTENDNISTAIPPRDTYYYTDTDARPRPSRDQDGEMEIPQEPEILPSTLQDQIRISRNIQTSTSTSTHIHEDELSQNSNIVILRQSHNSILVFGLLLDSTFKKVPVVRVEGSHCLPSYEEAMEMEMHDLPPHYSDVVKEF